jgi:hypothetical protein
MKTIFTAFAFLLCIDYTTAQTKLPDTFINVGVGIGANYGGLGTKAVVGFKNSGLLVGLGWGADPGYQIGGQISYKWAYATLSYGGLIRQRGPDQVPIPNETNLMFGAMLSLGKSKRSFIDLGIGQYLSAYTTETWAPYGWASSLNVAVGFGYRLGNKKNIFD